MGINYDVLMRLLCGNKWLVVRRRLQRALMHFRLNHWLIGGKKVALRGARWVMMIRMKKRRAKELPWERHKFWIIRGISG